MRMTFWFAEKGYELALGPALIEGAAACGDEVEMRPLAEYALPSTGGSIICGVVKREMLWEHQLTGVPLLYLDKGYHRARAPWNGGSLPAYWRLCWNAVHPTAYLMDLDRPDDRWRRLGVELKRRTRWHVEKSLDAPIVILGSSQKFHETEKIEHPTPWTQNLVRQISLKTKRPIIYRPKPSWAAAEPVLGAAFDHGRKNSVNDALAGAWCSITHASIACVDSIIAGVPCVVLGAGVAAPISSTMVKDVLNPLWVDPSVREQWAANLAYCQFTPDEIGDGTAWEILKETMNHAV